TGHRAARSGAHDARSNRRDAAARVVAAIDDSTRACEGGRSGRLLSELLRPRLGKGGANECASHDGGDERVRLEPGPLNLGREGVAEDLVERVDECFADGIEVMVLDAVVNVTLAERANGVEQSIRIVERGNDDRECLDQLLSLRVHVDVAEEPGGALIDLE